MLVRSCLSVYGGELSFILCLSAATDKFVDLLARLGFSALYKFVSSWTMKKLKVASSSEKVCGDSVLTLWLRWVFLC